MSKIEAFGADCCGKIIEGEKIISINPVADMFDVTRSLPSVYANPEKYDIHYCLDCLQACVAVPAENESPRAQDTAKHADVYAKFHYLFRRRVVNQYNEGKFFKRKKNK